MPRNLVRGIVVLPVAGGGLTIVAVVKIFDARLIGELHMWNGQADAAAD